MIDSVIAGTGNSRYLRTSISASTTWEDALTMLRAGTFPIDLAGINLDGFVTLGTALNADTLLKSTIITALDLDADATPSDAWEAVITLIGEKADADAVVTALSYNASTKTLSATINGASVTVATFNFTTPQEAAAVAPVQSVAGKTGIVALTKSDVGLGNVDNTSDADKPISTATQTALNAKQDTLTFDTTPTSGSTNPVTSGGIYTAVSQLESQIEDGLHTLVPVTLAANGWISGLQTVTVAGVLADETEQMITIVPASTSRLAFERSMVEAVGHDYNTVTFSFLTIPKSDLSVYVIIDNVVVAS